MSAPIFSTFLAGFALLVCALASASRAAAPDPFADLDRATTAKTNAPADPFADLERPKISAPATNQISTIAGKDGSESISALRRFFHDNFTFKREIMAEFSYSAEANHAQHNDAPGLYSRNSIGFEVLKKIGRAHV